MLALVHLPSYKYRNGQAMLALVHLPSYKYRNGQAMLALVHLPCYPCIIAGSPKPSYCTTVISPLITS